MRRLGRTGAALLVAVALGAGAATASCNWLVGAGDYAVATGGTDATTIANSSDAGAAACGQGLPIGRADFNQVISTCMLTVSCDPYFFPLNISECISNDYLHATGSVACLTTITDCAGFYGCQGFGFASAADCPSSNASTGCDMALNRAISCTVNDAGQMFNTVQDCTKLGGTCGTHGDPVTGAAVADCVVVPRCTPADGGGSQCAASKLYTCLNGVGYGQDCSNTISTCETVTGSTGCYLNAPPCTTPGYACNGDVLAWCTSAHTQLNYDCARAGQSCALDDAGAGRCLAPGCTLAAASDCVESCGADGHTLTVCVGGAPLDIDCRNYAPFTACAKATSGGTVYAYCI